VVAVGVTIEVEVIKAINEEERENPRKKQSSPMKSRIIDPK